MMDLLIEVSAGNPGALSVCCTMVNFLYEKLIKQDITGSEVWLLFKDCCNQDLTQFLLCLIDGSAMAKLQLCRYSRFYLDDEGKHAAIC